MTVFLGIFNAVDASPHDFLFTARLSCLSDLDCLHRHGRDGRRWGAARRKQPQHLFICGCRRVIPEKGIDRCSGIGRGKNYGDPNA